VPRAGGIDDLLREMNLLADAERAKSSAWFFKTGKGQYGEGDQFLGITVPLQRKLARRFFHLRLSDLARLLRSPIHEHRFTAAEILVAQYESAKSDADTEEIFRFYIRSAKRFNNWDLVDTSCRYVVGEHLRGRPRDLLDRLASSKNIWERRMAIVSTFAFLKDGETNDTFRIARLLLSDKHDLIHKAVGWLLRESGVVSRPKLLRFLEQNYVQIPRTALRYAIEHFPAEQRRMILAGKFSGP
jgi:3-methyladenine DNA glycosylase AlkD